MQPSAGVCIETIKEIRQRVGVYLAEIEAEGLESFSIQDAMTSDAVRRINEDLGICFGFRFQTKGDVGVVCLSHPSGPMAIVDPEQVLCAVRIVMSKKDNQRKLRGAPECAERHLFIVIDFDHYAPWVSLNDCDAPDGQPDLGDEATHLWVATSTRKLDEWVVWYTVRGGSWRRTLVSLRIESRNE